MPFAGELKDYCVVAPPQFYLYVTTRKMAHGRCLDGQRSRRRTYGSFALAVFTRRIQRLESCRTCRLDGKPSAMLPACLGVGRRNRRSRPSKLSSRVGLCPYELYPKPTSGTPHKTVRIECYLAFIGTFCAKSRVIPDTSRTPCTPSLAYDFFRFVS